MSAARLLNSRDSSWRRVAVAGVLEERHDVGVRHRDPVAPVVVAGEARAVLVGEPVEVGLVDEQDVADLGDVLVEAHADLDEPGHRRPDLLAGLRRQLVAGEADVAVGELEQAGQLAGQRRGLRPWPRARRSRPRRRVERQVDGPALEALGGRVAGGPDGGVGVDVGHEAGAAHRLGDHAGGGVERQQRRLDRPRRAGATAAATIASASAMARSASAATASGVALVEIERHVSDATGRLRTAAGRRCRSRRRRCRRRRCR